MPMVVPMVPNISALRRPWVSAMRPAGSSSTACRPAATRNPMPVSDALLPSPSVTNSGTAEARRPKTTKPVTRLTPMAAR